MLSKVLTSIFGTSTDRDIKRLLPVLDAVCSHEPRVSAMANDTLRAQTGVFKGRLAQGAALDDLLPEAFAVAREASKRVVGMRPFDVQILGGIVLHRGTIAEMVTGEGKTLVATMPVYLNALAGRGVHLVTVNDYLARRDAEWMGRIYEFLGLTVGLIQHDMTVFERQVGYRADITYGTNNEFGFDYLRDNMAVRPERRVQRELNYAIVDEVDSILVDEARTPLIISGRPEKATDLYAKVDDVIRQRRMRPNALLFEIQDFERLAGRLQDPSEPLRRHLPAELRDTVDAYDGNLEARSELEPAVTHAFLSAEPKSSDVDWVAQEAYEEIIKVVPPIELEEKHNQVVVTDAGMLLAERLLGVDNLYSNENIGLVHMMEQAIKAHHFFKRDDEYMVRDGEVLIVDDFTGRVMEGRRYSDGLHQALEAKERVPIKFESQTVASITYQNYFKLYNKIAGMTGTAVTEAVEFEKIYKLDVVVIPTNLPLIRDDMTDLVFATESGKFNYVTREIKEIHETGRPILVGTVSIEKSEVVAKLLEASGIEDYQVLNAKHHEREASIVANAGKRGAITIATNMAGRGTDIKLAEGVRELGGLCIIGTERHESRRIDNQLRGRCGRQGDPGATRFFVSLEDEVARLFGGDKVKKLLDFFGSQEMDDEPLSQRMVTRSIERAQRQVEEYNFEIRKHLLDYDLVMDKQRKYIYAMRRDVLEDRDIRERVEEMFENLTADAVAVYASEATLPEEWDLEGLDKALRGTFGFELDLSGESDGAPLPLVDSVTQQVIREYARRHEDIGEEIRRSYRQEIGGDESRIDFDRVARKRIHDLELMALLRAVDDRWIEHLYEMDYLRESVRLRAFGQKDPLLEYKQEGFDMFQEMVRAIEENVVQTLFRLTDPEVRRKREASLRRGTLTAKDDPFAQLREYSYVAADKEADSSFAAYDTTRFALAGQAGEAQAAAGSAGARRPKPPPVRVGPKVGPNDKCPCGSGKKYKKCCGRLDV